MTPKHPLTSLFLLVSFLAFTSQSPLPQTNNPTARKLEEFGDIQLSDLKARLDYFSLELQKEPTSKGFILVYRSRRDLPGISYRYAHRMEDYLVSTRGLARERVIAVDGGEADCLRQELWIVPPGTAPTPRSEAYKRYFEDTDSARKFDELSWGGDDAPGAVYAGELEAYADALHTESEATAYIIAYSGYYIMHESYEEDGKKRRSSEIYRDPPGTARKALAQARQMLMRKFHISSSRIRLMDGGYRKWGALDLWILPRGEHAPVPSPNSFPSRRANHRK